MMAEMGGAKRVEQAPQRKDRRLREAVAQAPSCILELDVEGRITGMNAAGLQMLGLNDVSEVSGTPFIAWVVDEERDRVEGLLQEASAGSTVELEFAARTPRGCRFFEQRLAPVVDDEGLVGGLVGIMQDVTDRRARERELRSAHEFREELFRTAQVIVLVLSGDGRIVDFNPFMERLSGYRLDEVRGEDWFETFLPERDRGRIRNVFRHALAGRRTRGKVNPIVTRDGRELDIEWYDSLLTEEDGTLRHILAIGHDVTEQRRSKEALSRSERKLRELSGWLLTAQEEERRYLSRELHDDLAQRLAVLEMELDQLRTTLGKKSSPRGEAERKLDELTEVVKGMSEQVTGMSHRLHPSMVEHLGLTAALARECDGVAAASGRAVVFDVEEGVPHNPPRAVAMCLYRVAQEAIRNAVTHSGSDRIEASLTRVDDGIRLTVEDRGRGFETRREGADWGLGLVSMRERSRLAGGTLDVRSRPGRGTAVACWVPLPKDSTSEPEG